MGWAHSHHNQMAQDGAECVDGSGLQRDGSGLQRDGSGLQKDGSGLQRDGSGLLRDGSGLQGAAAWVCIRLVLRVTAEQTTMIGVSSGMMPVLHALHALDIVIK